MPRSTLCAKVDPEVHAAWNDLLKVWTLPVIHTLGLAQSTRFNELKKNLVAISATSLTERLKELEERAYPRQPET